MTHWKPLCAAVLAFGLWFWAARDGRLHWDEAGYLYAAAYLDTETIVAAEFQPSGVAWHSTNRILHILFCHALYFAFGVEPIVIGLITGIYLALVLSAVYIGFLAVRMLVGVDAASWAAGILVMFTPVYLWLGFKTMPEAPALFFASVSVLALLKSLRGRPLPWLVVGAPCLTIVALLKGTLALSFLSFGLTLLLFNGFGFPLRRIVASCLLIGVGSLVLFAVVLHSLSISLGQYWSTWGVVRNVGDPIIARVVFTLLEAGLLHAALPLSLLVGERRHAVFMSTWFLLSTLPFPILLTHVEARFLLANLIPLMGLVVVSLRGLSVHGRLWRARRLGPIAVAVALVTLVLSGMVAQRVMAHEIEATAMRRLIGDLDIRFGPGNYSIVVPWLYSDFHYLRVAHPDLDVYTVFRSDDSQLSARWQKQQYGERAVVSLAELRQLTEPVVYLGFDESMPVANLRRMVHAMPVRCLDEWVSSALAQLSNESHFSASWMYDHPRIRLTQGGRQSHYRWARVSILPFPSPTAGGPR